MDVLNPQFGGKVIATDPTDSAVNYEYKNAGSKSPTLKGQKNYKKMAQLNRITNPGASPEIIKKAAMQKVGSAPVGGSGIMAQSPQIINQQPSVTGNNNANVMTDGSNTNLNPQMQAVDVNKDNITSSPSNNTTTVASENVTLYKAIPSIDKINKMTKEELLTLKQFLIGHCLKEALNIKDIKHVDVIAKEILKKWQRIPFAFSKYYSDVINEDLNVTYNKIVDYTSSDVIDNPVLSNLSSTVKSSLDQTMKLITQSSDWISIILSKPLNEWNSLFSKNKFGSLTIGKFLSLSALSASVVYIMTKLFKTGFSKESTLSECEDLFMKLYLRHSMNFKEGLEDKLQEYINKEVPSNVLTLNSLINNAYPLAMGLLYTIAYNSEEISQRIPLNILTLTEICAGITILWRESIGKKFKGLCKGKSMISSNLLMKMNTSVNAPNDIFGKLNDFKNSKMPNEMGGEVK